MNTPTRAAGPDINERTLAVWDGRIKMRVKVAGSGQPLVYLHPSAGLGWDPFLSWLAEHFTVYAPEFPGTSVGDPYAIHSVQSLSDVVLVYEELIRSLGLEKPILVGQSFGGMLAAELASAFPALASQVVLLDPIGLWREDLPVGDWISIRPEELPPLLFHDPASPAAQSMLALPDDPNIAAAAIAARVWAFGCTGKFAWPIPDRGLNMRLHRLTAPVLLVWGREDKLAPVGYVDVWREHLQDARAVVVENCGHIPQVEKLEETVAAVSDFLRVE
ncbi:Hydrolase or acyltransferase (Alpha/beta hydrolase superfamily)-like protein [Cupriavidus taiwanensis]|uniref:Hydrolase or acyltransferase (Alpha/beta hydrolase superfamily)-like protein n=1 Tax=Cupriavidus taiwanensis TaxID=164546 RepID=A0A375CQY3_9BURK|nr:alpha/beta hydrolase [Cupriavidus taiwanensis]SOY77568.1 Hydrolase or acyltransferase (Alpha/beta hydrolase superfamily)-like protein [Cupriavidus taiwanensis]